MPTPRSGARALSMRSDEPLLTIEEAAVRCRVATKTMRRWRAGADPPPFGRLHGRWLIPESELNAWIARRMEVPDGAA